MPIVQRWARGTFAALAVPSYRTYWLGLIPTFIALWAAWVARGFVAFDLTASSAALGGIFIAFGAPQLAFTLVGGVAADRLPRKRVVLAGVTFFAIDYALVGTLIASGLIEYWMLLVAALLEGVAVGIYIPSRTALLGDLVGDRGVGNAVALQQVSFNTTRTVAPAAAGALIATPLIGPGGTYLLAGAFFLTAAVVISRLPNVAPRTAAAGGSILREFAGGVAYVRGRPALLVLVLSSYIVTASAFPYVAFIPAVVDEVFDRGAVALGVMTSVIAIGALAAAVGVATIVDGPHAWRAHAASTLAFAAVLAAFALAPTFEVALLIGIPLGAAEIGFLAMNQSLAMRFSEPAYYGRVQALLMLGFALFGIAALPIGVVADAIGVRETLFAEASICGVLMAGVWLFARATHAADDAVSPVTPPLPAPTPEATAAPTTRAL